MLKVIGFISFTGLFLFTLAACGTGNEVKLDASDDGGQVELTGGQTLVVSLEGNPTNGYSWETAEVDEKILRQVGDPQFEADSDAVGAGGMQTLRYETVTSGQTPLMLVYRRPWEEGVAPEKTFSVQVTVR